MTYFIIKGRTHFSVIYQFVSMYVYKLPFVFLLSRDYIVSGSQDGVLAIWSLESNKDCLCQKQLFGRIEVVKARNNFLVTAHFGIAFDAGCISVRKINSPKDLPVVFAIYEV